MFRRQMNSVETLEKIAKRLRVHSVRSTTASASGHPSSCLSAADLVSGIFFHSMRFDPKSPDDPRADRFVLSKGHAAPLLWGVWAEAGVVPEKELVRLRKIDSELEGHPTPRFPWVDVATGSLGQGLSVGVGLAFNARLDKTDARIFVLLGDGECAEGSVWEAASLAAYYKLDHLVAVVDVNGLGQSQQTMFHQDVEIYAKRFESFGWESVIVNGHNMKEIVAALDVATAAKGKPVVLIAKTEKGKGLSFMEGKEGWHGKAVPADQLQKAIDEIGNEPPVKNLEILGVAGTIPSYAAPAKPEPPAYKIGDKVATRSGYGEGLKKLGRANPKVVALDGDTKNSTYSEKFLKEFPERFFECFIAEQNMVGVAAGFAARGKIPFASTFGAFLSRAYDQIRMAAVSKLPIKLCGSHAGVSIGEDGPSQMALEDLAMMRAIPQAAVLYPSDAVAAEKLVGEASRFPGMVYLRMGRPATPVLYPNDTEFPIGGSKVLKQSKQDRWTLVAAGVTLAEALKAYEFLQKKGVTVRVIDLYSVKPVDQKTLLQAGRETGGLLTVEDHYPEGGIGSAVCEAVSGHGIRVHSLAVNQIPRSGQPEELLDLCGISAAKIVTTVLSLSK